MSSTLVGVSSVATRSVALPPIAATDEVSTARSTFAASAAAITIPEPVAFTRYMYSGLSGLKCGMPAV